MIRGVLVVAIWASVVVAWAQDETGEPPEETWERAVAAEQAANPRLARSHYVAVRDAAPGSRLARRAQQRIDWIDARVDGPLEEVMRARANPSDRAALERLEEALRDAPPSLVVREGWTLAARAWERVGETRRAADAYRRWMALASGDERRRAAAGLAHVLERSGDPSGADRVIAREDLAQSAREIGTSRMRRGTRIASACILGMHVVLLFVMVGRIERGWRTLLTLRHGVVLLVLVAPALLARAYDPASWDSFVWLLVTSFPLLALAVLAGASVSTRLRRHLLAASAFIAQLALGVLVYTR